MADSATPRPFDKGYVLRVTGKHVARDIDISMRKTSERFAEFAASGDEAKAQEAFVTLMLLQGMKNTFEDFERANIQHFTGDQ